SKASDLVNAAASKKTNDAAAALQKLFVGDDAIVRHVDGAGTGVVTGPGGTPPSAADAKGPTGGKAGNIPLSEFMQTVSSSLIESQKALNKTSLDYISTLESHFPPAYYGIPSIKAEMKVGFQEMKGKGINLLLFTKSEQKNQYAESTVTFEVVGSPPPPGPVVFGDYVAPIPRFLVVGKKRAELIEQIESDQKLTTNIYANTRDQAIVLCYELQPDVDHIRYLVIWPAQKANSTLDNWHTVAIICVDEAIKDGVLDYPKTEDTAAGTQRETIFEYFLGPVFTPALSDPSKLGTAASFNTLKKLAEDSPDTIAKIVIDLGDVVMNVNLILNQWLAAVKHQKPAAPPGQ
ncbi:MAG TPA: hypothetical protein VN920_00375, partial [Pyrinomonadaceae bacterium]|nr:hypothetical protein [Pyrinomonadaceae bacterium]